jgi:plasmid stabilization system protein ParE
MEWYQAREPRVAARFRAAWEVCLELLAEAPERWPVYRVHRKSGWAIRRYVMPRFPFVVRYFVAGETAVVVAVVHTSRRPGFGLKRLS